MAPKTQSARRQGKGRRQGSEGDSAHQVDKRRHILKHAANLFAETGYAATTMDMLASVTEMNKASLYYYFDSKQQILFALLRASIGRAVDAAEPALAADSASDSILHLIRAGVENMYAQLDASRIFMQEFPYLTNTLSKEQFDELMALQRRYQKIVYLVINRGVDSGELRPGNVRLLGSLFTIWINAPLTMAEKVDAEQVIATLSTLSLGGIEQSPAVKA